MTIEDTLDERQKTHGDFRLNAETSQRIKKVFTDEAVGNLTAVQYEALDQIVLKISRILSGNNNEVDHWQDIAGYATLVVRDIERMFLEPVERKVDEA